GHRNVQPRTELRLPIWVTISASLAMLRLLPFLRIAERGFHDDVRTGLMNVLLLSMPDSFEHMPSVVIRMPNGALTSLAGNLDPRHKVAVADLVLVQRQVRETVERLVREFSPDVVGLSVMTFQRKTAKKIIDLVRTLKPDVRVAVGGYDP